MLSEVTAILTSYLINNCEGSYSDIDFGPTTINFIISFFIIPPCRNKNLFALKGILLIQHKNIVFCSFA